MKRFITLAITACITLVAIPNVITNKKVSYANAQYGLCDSPVKLGEECEVCISVVDRDPKGYSITPDGGKGEHFSLISEMEVRGYDNFTLVKVIADSEDNVEKVEQSRWSNGIGKTFGLPSTTATGSSIDWTEGDHVYYYAVPAKELRVNGGILVTDGEESRYDVGRLGENRCVYFNDHSTIIAYFNAETLRFDLVSSLEKSKYLYLSDGNYEWVYSGFVYERRDGSLVKLKDTGLELASYFSEGKESDGIYETWTATGRPRVKIITKGYSGEGKVLTNSWSNIELEDDYREGYIFSNWTGGVQKEGNGYGIVEASIGNRKMTTDFLGREYSYVEDEEEYQNNGLATVVATGIWNEDVVVSAEPSAEPSVKPSTKPTPVFSTGKPLPVGTKNPDYSVVATKIPSSEKTSKPNNVSAGTKQTATPREDDCEDDSETFTSTNASASGNGGNTDSSNNTKNFGEIKIFKSNGLKFKVLNKSKVSVYKGCTSCKSIPNTVKCKGKVYSVYGISANAFKGCKVKSVKLNKGLVAIGANAFRGCNALKKVVFQGKVELRAHCFKGAKCSFRYPKKYKRYYNKVLTKVRV